jgi:hypothetical protein
VRYLNVRLEKKTQKIKFKRNGNRPLRSEEDSRIISSEFGLTRREIKVYLENPGRDLIKTVCQFENSRINLGKN